MENHSRPPGCPSTSSRISNLVASRQSFVRYRADRHGDRVVPYAVGVGKKGQGSRIIVTSAGYPELIPVPGNQPTGDRIIHTPGGRLTLLPSGPLPPQQQNITALWSVPNYTAW